MTEHAAVVFVFFFLAEYGSILLMCILISVLFLGGYLPSMFATQDFYFINTFIEDWSLKVEELLYYNKLYLDNIISLITQTKYSTICYLDFMILTIFIYIFNEILFIFYDIIMLIVENYIDLVAFVNNNENENFEILALEGVFNGLILGLKSSIMVFLFIWIRAAFPRIRFDQLMAFC
jgi:NADH-ubiquinone oxidoreductase chain 1